jgi:hypothetical protein
MSFKRGLPYLLVLTLVIAACGQIKGVASSESQTTINASPSISTADSAPISGPGPGAGSYRQQYLSDFAPLIVHCMIELGWEATYDPQHGIVLPELPLAEKLERDGALAFCVAGSHHHLGIYAD